VFAKTKEGATTVTKNVKKPSSIKAASRGDGITVQMPLGMLEVLEDSRSAFFGLCIESGRRVLEIMMEADRTAVCGAKGRHDAERSAQRGGSTASAVTLGGRRIDIKRPRVRTLEGREVELPSFVFAADRDPLNEHTLEAIAAGVSSRKYSRTLDRLPDGVNERSVSKSSVSRRFVAMTEKRMRQWLGRRLDEFDIRVVMIDGKIFRKHCLLVALGLDSKGEKHVLGVREGTTENAAVAKGLLSDLIDRGLPADRSMLFVVDGALAVRKAIADTYGELGIVQRCQEHKRRNILDHLPDHLHDHVGRALTQAWSSKTVKVGKRQLERLASSLEREHPGAAGSVREGLEETLTLIGLVEAGGALYKTLRTTNPIENLNSSLGRYTRNVKRWRGGSMIQRWACAALIEAQKKFRRVRGYKEMNTLIAQLDKRRPLHSEEAAA
jgi:transposase-like protein